MPDRGTVRSDPRRIFAANMELLALRRVEREARAYARFSHGNLNGIRYRQREEARDRLLDALSELDVVRGA